MIDIQILPQQRLPDGKIDLRHRAVATRDGEEIGRVTVSVRSAPIPALCRTLWKMGAPEDEEVNVWRGTMPIFMGMTIELWAKRYYGEPDGHSVHFQIRNDWRERALKEKPDTGDDDSSDD